MTRVSNNSAAHAINYSLGRTKSKLEDLQIKGSNLKTIQKPSDNPEGSTEVLTIRSRKADGIQYNKNSIMAKTQLEYTENALADLTDVLVRAKELAVAQSSQTYNTDARKSVAEEVNQLYFQALSIANKRLGNKYIFSGTKTLSRPFDDLGRYQGDDKRIHLEVGKDRYIPINITGLEFSAGLEVNQDEYSKPDVENSAPKTNERDRLMASEEFKESSNLPKDEKANQAKEEIEQPAEAKSTELFSDLKSFYNALLTDNPNIIQGLLDKFDDHIDSTVKLRTKIGSLVNSINSFEMHNERDLIMQEEYMSKIEDADVMELYSELQKQQGVLDASYRTSASMLNKSLLQFIN
jgi:flagellar hook-associated protein 3 FlgL